MKAELSTSCEEHRKMEDLELFRDTFARVADAFGIMGDVDPQAVRKPLTDRLLHDHLDGKTRVGAYLIDVDGKADQLNIDILTEMRP